MSIFGKLIIFALWYHPSYIESSYVQTLNTSPGLFYEQVGRIKYYTSNVDVVTYVDLVEIERNVELSRSNYDKIYKLCTKSSDYCSSILSSLTSKMDRIKKKSESLFELLNENHKQHRVKRWWSWIKPAWNFISGAFKGYTDSKKYDEIIKTMNENNENFKSETNQKIQIIKSDIFSLNKTTQQILKNQLVMGSQIERIEDYLKDVGTKLETVQFDVILNRELLAFKVLLDHIDDRYNILINAVLFAKTGGIHPEIISPSEVLKRLQETVQHDQPNLQYMFPLSQDFIHDLIKVASLQVYYYNYQLVYIIQNPLGVNTVYNQYRLIPLPARRSDKSYVFIQPRTKYLAIDDNMLQYIAFDDINECKDTINFKICELNRPLSTLHGSSNCETELLLTPSSIPKSCDIMVTYNEYEILHSMETQNAWLYVFSKPQDASLNCPNSQTEDVILEDIGVLRVPEGCTLRTKNKILTATKYHSSNSSIIPLKADILSDERCKDDLNKRSQEDTLKAKYLVESSLDDLKRSSKDLIAMDSFQNNNIVIYATVGAVFGACIILLLIYMFFKCCIALIKSSNSNEDENRQSRTDNIFLNAFKRSNLNNGHENSNGGRAMQEMNLLSQRNFGTGKEVIVQHQKQNFTKKFQMTNTAQNKVIYSDQTGLNHNFGIVLSPQMMNQKGTIGNQKFDWLFNIE